MTADRKRAVAYVRQSLTRGEVDESLSLESQERACREYVARQGWQLVHVYIEPDTKGWRTDRPQFAAMLESIREGRADTVVVYKLSRFARNLIHQETVLGDIAEAGGDLVSVTEPHLNASPMVRQILGAVNEQHKRDQADFLRISFAARARRGLHHGYAPIGYRMEDGRLVPDETAAPMVRQMFAWALEGHGSPEIAYRLNQAGQTTAQGHPWEQSTVLRALSNPVYAGDVRYRGDVVASDAHPPLVDRVTFDAVQGILQRRRKQRRKTSPSWADGFVYHACGARMYAASWSVAGAPKRWRFRCGVSATARKDRGTTTCTMAQSSLFADVAEDEIVRLLGELRAVRSPQDARERMLAYQQAHAGDTERLRETLTRRVDDLARQRDRLLDLTLAGRVDDEMYVMRDAALKEDIAQTRRELATLPPPVSMAAMEHRYDAIRSAVDAIAYASQHARDRMPAILHALDARLTVSPDGCRLDLGRESAAFLL